MFLTICRLRNLKVNAVLAGFWTVGLCIGTVLRVHAGSAMRLMGIKHVALHAFCFIVLGFLFSGASANTRVRILLALVGVLVGFSTEFYEHAVGGAELEWADISLDSIGVLVGLAAQQLERRSTAGNSD
jgi:hypothetical protein